MHIIRGNFFGYFIASVYLCPFFLAVLLFEVPTTSFIAVVMFLVNDADLFTDPFRSPTFPLLVVVAFFMWYTFWQHVERAIATKLFVMRTVSRVDVLFIRFPDSASPCTRFDAVLWRRPARWLWWCLTAVPMTAPLLVFLASSCSITCIFHQAFAV